MTDGELLERISAAGDQLARSLGYVLAMHEGGVPLDRAQLEAGQKVIALWLRIRALGDHERLHD